VTFVGKKKVVSAARVEGERNGDSGVRDEDKKERKSGKGAQLEPGGLGKESGEKEH